MARPAGPPRNQRRRRAAQMEQHAALIPEPEAQPILPDDEIPREPTEENICRLVIPMLMDINAHHTSAAIARQVAGHFDIPYSVRDLDELYRTPLFQQVFPLGSAGHDPRIDVAKAAIVDAVTLATQEMLNLLRASTTPATVKARLIEKVYELANVQASHAKASNTNELEQFFREMGVVNVTQVNIGTLINGTLPEEYLLADEAVNNPTVDSNMTLPGRGSEERLEAALPAQEIVEGEFEEV